MGGGAVVLLNRCGTIAGSIGNGLDVGGDRDFTEVGDLAVQSVADVIAVQGEGGVVDTIDLCAEDVTVVGCDAGFETVGQSGLG